MPTRTTALLHSAAATATTRVAALTLVIGLAGCSGASRRGGPAAAPTSVAASSHTPTSSPSDATTGAPDTPDPTTTTTATPTPTPTPTTPPTPSDPPPPRVRVRTVVDVVDVGNAGADVVAGAPAHTLSPARARTLRRQVTRWLDRHLAALARGRNGGFGSIVRSSRLARAAPDRAMRAMTRGLSRADDPAVRARYLIRIAHRGEPEWVTVHVATRTRAGRRGAATFVFVPTEGGVGLVAGGHGGPRS